MAEKEYIEREEAIESFRKNLDGGYVLTNDAQTTHILQSLPAADVRPVVLCRDCEYYQADCGWCGLLDIGMNVNGFCSRGEKREES